MTTTHWITLVACVSQLALALIAILRGGKSPIATWFALVCLDISTWTGATVAHAITGSAAWDNVDHASSPWTSPLALHFVLVFVGRRRAYRHWLVLAYLGAAAISIPSLVCLLSPRVPMWRGPTWDGAMIALAIPTMGAALVLLTIHLRRASDPNERARARLLLSSIALATTLGLTELINVIAPWVPSLSAIGMLASTVPMALVTMRFRLFDREYPLRIMSNAMLIAALSVAIGAAVLRFAPRAGFVVIGSVVTSLAVIAIGRNAIAEAAARRERVAHLSTLGRFSAQMAHDLKNPLAALRGAAQVLEADLEKPSDAFDRSAFVALMLAQIDRIGSVVDTYGRLASAEPSFANMDLNEVTREAIALESLDGAPSAKIRAELDAELPPLEADPRMVATILENLVRNARQATSADGTITVRTRREDTETRDGMVLEVADTGVGMDARTQERAFDDFFTTLADGSGLGLAFVRRLVAAHGGEVTLTSRVGHGTIVRVWLPREHEQRASLRGGSV